jgi:hypothetical protein
MRQYLVMAFILGACSASHQLPQSLLPKAIVYKTKMDWSDRIPIILNGEKTEIISYPSPHDISIEGNLKTPTALKKGFFLDNYGVGPNSVFISLTYAVYAKRKVAPSLDSLYLLIIDKNPITEMWDLGVRNEFADKEQLDVYIDNGFKGATSIVRSK